MNKIIKTFKKILSRCFVQLKKIYNKFISSLSLMRVTGVTEGVFKYKFFFILPFVLDKLNIENVSSVENNSDPLLKYAFNMFVLSSIVLICFINIIGFIVSMYLLNKYDIEGKYPKLIKFINFFKKTSEINILIEIFVALLFLIAIVALNLFLFITLLNK